jgi:uncharacterized cupredoxin-like copper-binding protein
MESASVTVAPVKRLLLASPLAALLLVTACGGDDKGATPAASFRTVNIDMVDIDFNPASVNIKHGETITFVFHNRGKVDHDAFIGDAAAQAVHEAEMAGMTGHHTDSDAVTVKPGMTGSLTHTFGSTAAVEIGCHEPGHYTAGMRVRLNVT